MLFSRRKLFKIMIPLLAQQILAVTIGMADSMMVSSAGEAAVSGVSLVNSLDLLLIYAFSSLSAGGAVVISQALGKKDRELSQACAKQLVFVVTGVALALSIVVMIFRYPLLDLLFGDVEADVMQNAQGYFFYMLISFPFLGLYYAGAAIYQAMGNTVVSMTSSVLMNLINVGGNALFIFGFGMGAVGAAIATLISRVIGSVIMCVLIHNKHNELYVEKLYHYKPDIPINKNIMHIGIPNGVENSMFQFGKLLTQSLISSLGTAVIAANAVAHTMATFQYMPGAIGTAMVTVVGRCVGAEEKEQAKKYAKKLTGYAYVTLWIIVGLTILLSDVVIGIYNLSGESSILAKQFILYHALFASVIWPIGFVLPSAFRAASDVRFTLYVSAFSMWLFRVAFGYVFTLESISIFGLTFPGLGLGAMGVWVAMSVDWVFRTALFAWRFLSGKWLTKYKPIKKE